MKEKVTLFLFLITILSLNVEFFLGVSAESTTLNPTTTLDPITTADSTTTVKPTTTDKPYSEDDAKIYSNAIDADYNEQCNVDMVARWDHITDLENAEAEANAINVDIAYAQFQSDIALTIQQYSYEDFEDVELYRKFRFQKDRIPGSLGDEDLSKYQQLLSSMESLYSSATICDYNDRTKCDLQLEPDIENIMATSTDFEELSYAWLQWREVTGKLMKDDYLEFVTLSNLAAIQDNDYLNTGDYWLNGYTVTEKEVLGYDENGTLGLTAVTNDDFKMLIDNVFSEVQEKLYKPLHAFVRMKLKETSFYSDYIDSEGTLPAHILGNMWAQDWTNIASHVMPFPEQPDFDVTQSMIDNNWDIEQIFTSAEDFFTSIGLYPMTYDFSEKSIFNETKWGKAIVCHASAEDFCLGPGNSDFRIKMCTQVNMGDLITAHHEMGHIEYFMAYTDLSHVFRTSANPGFHEAIGDLIALSVSTPKHMEDILHLSSSSSAITKTVSADYTVEEQQQLNFLMRMALEKIAFLPYAYILDKYRWDIFEGITVDTNLNENWWKLREEFQGVSPPLGIKRGENYSDRGLFDAGSKYHVPANVPYIRYFVSYIVQFQFHKHLCDVAGFEGSLSECDIYGNTNAGSVLLEALQEGFSKPWPLILNQLGGSMDMNADAITEYFQPLLDYLNETLAANEELIGWTIPDDSDNIAAAELLLEINTNLTALASVSVHKSWEYNTNITDENLAAMNEASAEYSQAYNEFWNSSLTTFNYLDVTDPYLRRQFEIQQTIGTSILEAEDLDEFNFLVANMSEQLGNKVCPYEYQTCDVEVEGYDIDYLEILMGTTKDYDELSYYWEQWRFVSGKEMLVDYPEYVRIMNQAAEMNGFNDGSEMWLNPYVERFYSSDTFKTDIQNIWKEIEPFYKMLHSYVRMKLSQNQQYSSNILDDGLIPANILGDMYAQSWVNIYDQVAPYPEIQLIDLTPVLEENIDQEEEMFQIAESFFHGIGLSLMSSDFNENTQYVQPETVDVVCHASAWDFYSVVDSTIDGEYRIKMCTNKTQEDFLTIHHEMGHIEYYMSYYKQDYIYRDGANPGFHEAIGDTIALSVSTPNHLKKIEAQLTGNPSKLSKRQPSKDTVYKEDLNFLMKQALDKVAFLPYAYILDEWRWQTLDGTIKERSYNYDWWEKRIGYQGIKPPVPRSKNEDFDIGCKYHVPSDVPYIRYFVATILQFQFHERLCQIANSNGPIYACDIDNSTQAGAALNEMMQNGRSQNWQTTLADFLGDPNAGMSANSILTYFAPLIEFLDQQITDNNLPVGWDENAIETYVPSGNIDFTARHILNQMDANLTVYAVNIVDSTWNYYTDVTDENRAIMDQSSSEFSQVYKEWWEVAIQGYDYTSVSNETLRREFELQQSIGTSILNEEDLSNFNKYVGDMTENLNHKICPYDMKRDCNKDEVGLDIDTLEILMGTETDYDILQYYWTAWREVSGRLMKNDYESYVELVNKAAVANGFVDGGEMWLDPYTETLYTTANFKNDLESIWEEIKPLYETLHAYVRKRLRENPKYDSHFNDDNLIPANILGDMYSQSWANIYDAVVPYKEVELINLTPILESEINEVKEMFGIAEDFFTSIGLYAMNEDFVNNTMYEKPEDREVICHASAWDFYSTEVDNIEDGRFRIKMCTDKIQEDFITIHHEMGHIQYYMAYGSQDFPLVFRDGANPGFHEAIGDTIALSVSTPDHLRQIADYLDDSSLNRTLNATEKEMESINFLMKQALDKIAFLPFAYIMDQWRWEVFAGEINPKDYNYAWWQKRLSYQGIRPPVIRSAGIDFDIGCKYHIPTNTPYIRYFVATILQFQFHERLCTLAESESEIHMCDIYNSTSAGNALEDMIKKGSSEPWRSQLQEFLDDGSATLNASSILEYFQPLQEWLDNQVDPAEVGWDDTTVQQYLTTDLDDTLARILLHEMDSNLTEYAVQAVDAAWEFNTDINEETEMAMNEASANFSMMYNTWWAAVIQPYDYSGLNDSSSKRQYEVQQSIGTAILNEEDLNEFNLHVSTMTNLLSNKICPYLTPDCDLSTEGLDIDTLEVLMGTQKDFDELTYYWTEWRAVSGANMLDDFPPYVDLLNKAAVANGFNDASEMWLDPYAEGEYTSTAFQQNIQQIWSDLEPFYQLLHAFVRKSLKLQNNYADYFNEDDLIPSNILGNMYAQSWVNIYDYVTPYPEVEIIDLTPILSENIKDVREMFEIAEDFFTSIGLYAMNEDFVNNTMYEKPDDRDVICHGSAWDFYSTEVDNIEDGRFRIKMCTDKNQEDFITVHHEMGHIEYFMAYSNESYPIVFRNGANPGFHEAIGDTIALSVSTPGHLQMISDYLKGSDNSSSLRGRRSTSDNADITDDEKENINFLMKQALDKIPFLPFAYILDEWRWSIFDGDIKVEDYNYEWWQRRLTYQGISPPVLRSPTTDFDAGCKFHVPSNVPYIRYFVAAILQFQFHERLCDIAQLGDDLSQCDIYNNTEAGTALKTMLQKGYSEPWQLQLQEFLNDDDAEMTSSSILKYFDPLITWLGEQVDSNEIGWDDSTIDNYVDSSANTTKLVQDLKEMDTNLTVYAQDAIDATWVYYTNETDYNLQNMNEATELFSKIYKSWWEEIIKPATEDLDSITDEDAKRQVEMQKSIGVAILDAGNLTRLNFVIGNMSDSMNNKICPYNEINCDTPILGIDELEMKMGTERDYSTLLYYWDYWREESGDTYVDMYPEYVTLLNQAANLNNFNDSSDMWINKYTWEDYITEDFTNETERLWRDIEPFYKLLHAYVRDKLNGYNDDYEKSIDEDNGLIPAHILGNMYAQSWINIYDLVAPYPEVNLTDITSALEEKITNVTEMFDIAEDFFTSIDLYEMTDDFTTNSMYEQPPDRTVVCHASAMDFRSTEADNIADGKFRIKMCTDKNEEDFITIHHEMGHIEYFMAYSNSTLDYPLIYRNGANPGFHEAIGDTIALSVSTQEHMSKIIDYLENNDKKITKQNPLAITAPKENANVTEEEKSEINFLMKQALDKVAFLPYAYILDQWRWEVFDGSITSDQYNYEWWRKRIDYQGLCPPIKRTRDTNFDIGCKYHVAANVPYIRYFVATILQFQFHQKLCAITNQDVLHKCDIYQMPEAGNALLEMLAKGASEPWQDQLQSFLGDSDDGKMSSAAILAYFDPLITYLENYVNETGIEVGWSNSTEVLDDFFKNSEDIGAVVPIVVGAVLAILVCIVVVVFFVGQKRRKENEKKEDDKKEEIAGKVNEAIEMEDKEDI